MSETPKYPDARPEMQAMFRERWARFCLPTPAQQTLDSRQDFIVRWLQMKYHSKATLPTTWPEMAEWLLEFDKIRNDYNVKFEEMFREHMETCVRPIFIPSAEPRP